MTSQETTIERLSKEISMLRQLAFKCCHHDGIGLCYKCAGEILMVRGVMTV